MKRTVFIFFLLISSFNAFSQQSFNIEKNTKIISQIINNANENDKILAKIKIKNYESTHNIIDLISAINLFPTGDSYFLLGDYFFDVKDYEEAIVYYMVSINLDYEKKYYSYYNIACAYSILKSFDESYNYLIAALDEGYKHFDWIYKDKDIYNLLNNEKYKILIPYSIESYKEKYYENPIKIAQDVYKNNLKYTDLINKKIEWNINDYNYGNGYIFTYLTSRSSLDPHKLVLFCFSENELQFIITPDKINTESKEMNSTTYITFLVDEIDIDNNIINESKLIYNLIP